MFESIEGTSPNLSYLSTMFESEVVSQLAKELVVGFENPEKLNGRCLFDLVDGLNDSHFLSVVFTEKSLQVTNAPISDYDACIRMPLSVADKIVSNIENVDYRDPDIIGSMEMEGNLNIVNHLAKALVKPSSATQGILADATENYRDAYAIKTLTHIEDPTEMEILELIERKQPFVIRNASIDSSHVHWTLEELKQQYCDVMLRVRSATQRETVGEFIDRLQNQQEWKRSDEIIEGHTKVYTEGCALPWEMVEDFLPRYFTTHDYTDPQVWLGSVPTNVPASSLHRDPLDAFLYQVMGRKKVLLFSPDQAPYLYPMKAYNNYQPCWVKPNKPNYDHFPEFRKAQRLEVILHPGEILVQPAGWFHEVYCLDSPTFSVSYFLNFPVGIDIQEFH